MPLDLSPLDRALAELALFLGYADNAMRPSRPPSDDGHARAFKAAAIQAFEFSYELSHKMLRRHLEMTRASPDQVALLKFPELIRLGGAHGRISADWKVWAAFREARSITSHTYDRAKADLVYKVIPEFLQEARHLLRAMQKDPAP